MSTTIKDLAKATGLSLATISKYLNGGNVKEENRNAIQKAIKKTGFQVNQAARSLKSGKTKMIGFIIPQLDNLFITTIISTAEAELRKHGYAVMICDCNNDTALEKNAVEFLLQRGAECIVNMPVNESGKHLRAAIRKGNMVVLIDRFIEALQNQVNCVLVDNLNASYEATKALLNNGHTDIAIIVGPPNIYTSQQRLQGYQMAMVENNEPKREDHIFYSDYTIEGGYQVMMSIIKQHREITAVFVTNYEMTMGAILAMNEAGITYPKELSIIGFDHLILSRFITPPLTTVSQPMKEMGMEIANLIVSRLNSQKPEKPKTLTLKTTLQKGETILCRNTNDK